MTLMVIGMENETIDGNSNGLICLIRMVDFLRIRMRKLIITRRTSFCTVIHLMPRL